MDRETTCCFSGHRPAKLPWCENENDPRCLALKADIAKAVEEAYDRGYRHFICGMALGTDLYFCEAVQALRDRRPGVTLEAAIPCKEQSAYWSQASQKRYRELVDLCDFETVIQQNYDRACMLRRNRYMVDHSSLLIVAFNGTSGGTMNTILYAMRQGVQIRGVELDGFRYKG